MKRVFVLVLLFVALLIPSAQAIFLGTVEGYIYHQSGTFLPGATVTVTIPGCLSTNCQGTAVSDSGGYYVITNLDLAAGGQADVAAQLGNSYGTNTDVADTFFAAFINVTTCDAPGSPILINPPTNTHDNTLFVFDWTSGIDPNLLITYDVFTYNNQIFNNTTPSINKENLNYTSYAWRVETCNQFCCSPPSISSFSVINSFPTSPVLQNVPNGVTTEIFFNWSNATDADGDEITYDFILDGVIIYDTTWPITRTVGGGAHTWGARACDFLGCSNFAYDQFSIINNAPSAPVLNEFNHTENDTVNFNWVGGVDPDTDPVHDEFQIATQLNFGTIVFSDANAISPLTLVNIDYFAIPAIASKSTVYICLVHDYLFVPDSNILSRNKVRLSGFDREIYYWSDRQI